jgi:hypothetical protein
LARSLISRLINHIPTIPRFQPGPGYKKASIATHGEVAKLVEGSGKEIWLIQLPRPVSMGQLAIGD